MLSRLLLFAPFCRPSGAQEFFLETLPRIPLRFASLHPGLLSRRAYGACTFVIEAFLLLETDLRCCAGGCSPNFCSPSKLWITGIVEDRMTPVEEVMRAFDDLVR